jgi:hypothetical protein
MISLNSKELEKFYSNKLYFSYSGINKLLYSPRLYYKHYILNEKEDGTDTHLVAGRAAHCLLLEPDVFDDLFTMMPGKIPTDSNKVIIDYIFINNYLPMKNDSLTLEDFPQDILNQLLTNNLYQNLTDDKKDKSITGDSKRLEKILTDNNKEYFNFLKTKETKTVIDFAVKEKAQETVNCIRENKTISALMCLDHDNSGNVTVYNELALLSDWDEYPFGFKGIIDNIVIDENIKTIFINDLKLTNKLIQDFPDSVYKFRYDLQSTIYRGLAYDKFISHREDAKEWKIVFTFIVADKYNQIYPFQVSETTADEWQSEFYSIVKQLEYHYNTKDYTLPYELAVGNIKL